VLKDVTEDQSYKAQAFAAFAGAHRWDVEARRITHRDYPTSDIARPAGP